MDKATAIEMLKQCLEEIPHLKGLQYDNSKFELWRDKVEQIIRSSLSQDDFKTFISTNLLVPVIDFLTPNNVRQNYYLERLVEYGVNIEKIIQKYEILGVETKPTAPAEPAKDPQDEEEKAANRELELVLEGNPDMILECIRSTSERLNSQGYTYSFRRTSDTPDYAKWDKTYFASCAISQGNEGQIGTIKLQLLPKDQTLLSVPEPKDWKSSFGFFLSYLLGEFKRLGFVHFEEEKPPLGFKPSHKEKDV